jgi:hypothetical protein
MHQYFAPHAPQKLPTEIFSAELRTDGKTIVNRFYLPYRVAHSYAQIQISMQCHRATDAAETCATTTKTRAQRTQGATARGYVISTVSPRFVANNLSILNRLAITRDTPEFWVHAYNGAWLGDAGTFVPHPLR